MWTHEKNTVLLLLISCYMCKCEKLKFPPGFKLGVATASYQIEGGWNASGKGESIWDHLTHTYPNLITDGQNGDVACDSYHQWQTDIKMLSELKVDHYRFSLSWPRLLPTGFPNKINPDGVRYYNNIIDSLIFHGIEPMVTLYHWDLPQPLQELGGWTNPILSDYFRDFAIVAIELFGDRVKKWITINEPASICVDTYESDQGAPAFVKTPGIGLYLCGKTILLAHAKAYRAYHQGNYDGKMGITIDSIWAEPKTNSSEDLEAAEREMQFNLGWWAHPIFSTMGDYPEVMKNRIRENSKKENFTESRLPVLTSEEIKMMQGTYDFLGLNHYHTWLAEPKEYKMVEPSYQKDKGTQLSQNSTWKPHTVPWGFRKLLNWIKNEYNNVTVFVTENGYPDKGDLVDSNRCHFLYGFMRALLLALLEDKCNIIGYTVWSLIDNMEWRSGYTKKFGLYYVDFLSVNRTRTPKASARFYRFVAETRSLPQK